MEFPPDHSHSLWKRVPLHLREGLLAYIMDRRPTGDFLKAILSNDLAETFARNASPPMAGEDQIWNVLQYLYNCAPSNCHGSPEKVAAWLSKPRAQ